MRLFRLREHCAHETAHAAHPFRTPRRWPMLAACAVALLITTAGAAHAAKLSERNRQQQAAETERAALRNKLSALKRDISRTESAKTDAGDALADSEAAISEANRSLRELAQEQRQTEARLQALSKEHTALARKADAQRGQLAKLLRDHYVTGNEDRVKLLLSGDNPNRINRDLQYMGYVSKAQAQLLDTLRTSLQAVEQNKTQAQDAKDELDEIAQEQQEQKKLLEKEKARRAALLSQLSTTLAAQRKHAENPKRKSQNNQAPEGTEDKTKAGGRVIFAEWLRGFGNLIIIDHGQQYMTIYGNKQEVLKRAGDFVLVGVVFVCV